MKNNKGFTIVELVVVLVIVLGAVLFLQPFARETAEKSDKDRSLSNLREMGRALFIYAREHHGDFPPALKTLYTDEYLADVTVVDCPGTKTTGTPEEPEYVYTPGLSINDPSGTVLVRDKHGNYPGGYGSLDVDGIVAWHTISKEHR